MQFIAVFTKIRKAFVDAVNAAGRYLEEEHRWRIVRDGVAGILLTLAITIGFEAFRSLQLGEDLRWMSFRFLQRRLVPSADVPVTIVDIGRLRPDASGVTPRYTLRSIVMAVAANRPKAIGIDIDFSPMEAGSATGTFRQFVTGGDMEFFDDCRKLRDDRHVPVYLGIYRTRALPPDQWLGLPKYSELAAALLVPAEARKVPQSLHTKNGLTMSSALVHAYTKEEPLDRKWLAFTRVSEHGTVQESPVDYSVTDYLTTHALTICGESLCDSGHNWERIHDKMVLIGDLTSYEDPFTSPIGEDPVPGVLIHAAAAYTAVGSPLYEIDERLEGWIDPALAISFIVFIAYVRLRFGERYNEHRLLILLTTAAVLCVLAFGALVNAHRILWDDFLIVAVALAIHPTAHKFVMRADHNVVAWLRTQE